MTVEVMLIISEVFVLLPLECRNNVVGWGKGRVSKKILAI
jgi:hypothetical protein